MKNTKMKKLMIPVAAATTLAATALAACGGQSTDSSTAASEQTSGATVASATVASATAVAASSTSAAGYTDGTYQGDAVTIRWGDVQVQVTIQDGEIAAVQFLTYPTDQHSLRLNTQAEPLLIQEAVQSQSADVQVVSGATFTSLAFIQSLESALSQA